MRDSPGDEIAARLAAEEGAYAPAGPPMDRVWLCAACGPWLLPAREDDRDDEVVCSCGWDLIWTMDERPRVS